MAIANGGTTAMAIANGGTQNNQGLLRFQSELGIYRSNI